MREMGGGGGGGGGGAATNSRYPANYFLFSHWTRSNNIVWDNLFCYCCVCVVVAAPVGEGRGEEREVRLYC